MKKRAFSQSLIAAALALGLAGQASAALIAEHSGSNDPLTGDTTQWTQGKFGGSGSAVTSGTPAWHVPNQGSTNAYIYAPTAAQNADAAANGWVLGGNVRVPTANKPPNKFRTYEEYAGNDPTNPTRYFILFGSNANGEQQVQVNSDSNLSYTISGSTTSEFHLSQLVYDPATHSADLYVDGQNVLQNISSIANTSDLNRVIFGDNSSNNGTSGGGDYNLVRLQSGTAIPEPATLALVGLGGLALAGRPRGRSREGAKSSS